MGDSAVATDAIAVGADGHPTPPGTFTIKKLIWNPRWVPPKQPWARGKTAKAPSDPDNPMQTVKIFFKEPDYYITALRRSNRSAKPRPKGASEWTGKRWPRWRRG